MLLGGTEHERLLIRILHLFEEFLHTMFISLLHLNVTMIEVLLRIGLRDVDISLHIVALFILIGVDVRF